MSETYGEETLELRSFAIEGEPKSQKRSSNDPSENVLAKTQRLARYGCSVSELLASSREVESLGTDVVFQQREAQDANCRYGVSVSRNVIDIDGYKTEVYRAPSETPGARK